MEQMTANVDKIIVRPTREADLDYVLEAEWDSENSEFVCQWTREQHREIMADSGVRHLIIEDSESRKPVGYTIIAGVGSPNRSIELKRIVVTAKGKGYGKAALELIKGAAFGVWNAHRLWLDVRVHNERAKQLYRSLGFVEEGTLRECVLCKDKYVSIIIMSILENEYE